MCIKLSWTDKGQRALSKLKYVESKIMFSMHGKNKWRKNPTICTLNTSVRIWDSPAAHWVGILTELLKYDRLIII